MEKIEGYPGVYSRKDANGGETLYVVYRDGSRQIRKSVGKYISPATAAGIRLDMIKDAREARAAASEVLTMDRAFELFQTKYCVMEHLKVSKADKSRYNRHIKPVFGDKKLSYVSNVMINNQKLVWSEALSPGSVKQVMALISRIYNAVGNQGLGVYDGPNPMHAAKKVKVQNERQRFLTKAEAFKFMETLLHIDLRTYRLCAFMLYAGFRKSEALNIRMMNIDLDRMKISVKTKDPNIQGKIAYLPILPQLMDVIVEMFMDKEFAPNEKIFGNKPFNYRAFYTAVNALGLNDNVEWKDDPTVAESIYRVVPHTLRHSFASHLVEDGVNLETVRRLMRHASITMTMRYVKASDEQLAYAMEVLADSWNNMPKS